MEGGGAQLGWAKKAVTGLLSVAVALAAAFVLFGGLPEAEPDDTEEAAPQGSAASSVPQARLRPAAPVRLIVPALELRAPVVPIEMNTDGVLHPPDDVREVGWWQRSAKPGARKGQTLLTGHTVSSGGGVMDDLGKLAPGDRVRVKSPRGTVIYETTRVRDYSTEQVAAQARKLFGQDRGDGRLVLVTCSDWNGEVYESNTIVFAERIGARRTKGPGRTDTAALAAS